MSWRYVTNQNRVVSDGKVLKIYEAENKQMYEQDVNKSQYPAALSFLMGTGQSESRVQISETGCRRFPGWLRASGTPLEQYSSLSADGAVRRCQDVPGAPRAFGRCAKE